MCKLLFVSRLRTNEGVTHSQAVAACCILLASQFSSKMTDDL